MTSKRDLESDIETLKNDVKAERRHAEAAWAKVQEIYGFLNNLLELDPTLDHFRRDEETWGHEHRVWDIEGVKAAKEFNQSHAIAAKYTEQEVALRRSGVASKAAAK